MPTWRAAALQELFESLSDPSLLWINLFHPRCTTVLFHHVALLGENLVRSQGMLDEGLPSWEDERQYRIDKRRRNKAKQPTKLVRVDAHANVDVVVDSIDETWERCISRYKSPTGGFVGKG